MAAEKLRKMVETTTVVNSNAAVNRKNAQIFLAINFVTRQPIKPTFPLKNTNTYILSNLMNTYAPTVKAVVARKLSFHLSRQQLDPIKLAYIKPLSQQYWKQGPLLPMICRFFPSSGQNITSTHCTYPRTESQAKWPG